MRARTSADAAAQPSLRDGTRAGRLGPSQQRRLRRILAAAVALAERGGFEAVRLRDVAQESQVALGTLYKYFHSKEDILLLALTEEVERLEAAMVADPLVGGTPLRRLTEFFQRATQGLTRRPHLARAVLRAIASGDRKTAEKVAAFHERMTRMIHAAQRGKAPDLAVTGRAALGDAREQQIAFLLQHVWFASLVGWAGGLHSTRTVAEQVSAAAALMRIDSRED
jgi:TetR/AcrR family transcriptional regulator, cholesterol catabolism regulator